VKQLVQSIRAWTIASQDRRTGVGDTYLRYLPSWDTKLENRFKEQIEALEASIKAVKAGSIYPEEIDIVFTAFKFLLSDKACFIVSEARRRLKQGMTKDAVTKISTKRKNDTAPDGQKAS
jgi:hypothetical protein